MHWDRKDEFPSRGLWPIFLIIHPIQRKKRRKILKLVFEKWAVGTWIKECWLRICNSKQYFYQLKVKMFCLTVSCYRINDTAIICWLRCVSHWRCNPLPVSQHCEIHQSMKTIKSMSMWRHDSCKGTRSKRLATLESSAAAVWHCSRSMGQRMRSWCIAFLL